MSDKANLLDMDEISRPRRLARYFLEKSAVVI